MGVKATMKVANYVCYFRFGIIYILIPITIVEANGNRIV